MYSPTQITAIIVNYKTPDLTTACVESFCTTYPDVPLILIDNGSDDQSRDYIAATAQQFPVVTMQLNSTNLYHGPAMDQGIRMSNTPYVFTLDSDCIVQRPGFLEAMLEQMISQRAYAVGSMHWMDRFGYDLKAGDRYYTRYIHPYAMLLDRTKYLGLPPFFHHGSPCLRNMHAAQRRSYGLLDFPVADYIEHLGRGTCSRYGYGLGITTTIGKYLNKWLRH